MSRRILVALFILIPFALGTIPFVSASPPNPEPILPVEEAEVYDPLADSRSVPIQSINGYTEVVMYGLNWFPRKENMFSKIKRRVNFGGTRFWVKTPGSYNIDISLPLETVRDTVNNNLSYVEFCGYSSNASSAKPKHWELWAEETLFYEADISWPNSSSTQCVYKSFNIPKWRQSLAISVLVKLKNTNDSFTLKKAFVRFVH